MASEVMVMLQRLCLSVFGVIGIPLGSAIAVLGVLICVDAFIPKSKPVPLMVVGVEFVSGGIVLLVGVLLFRVARAALEQSRLIRNKVVFGEENGRKGQENSSQ